MANLIIENKLSGGTPPEFLFREEGRRWRRISPNATVTIGTSDPNKKYFSRLPIGRTNNKTIFFAMQPFTHCVQIIDINSGSVNTFKIRIAPIEIFSPTTNLDKILRVLDGPDNHPSVPIANGNETPGDVYIKNGYSAPVSINGQMNGNTLNENIPNDGQFKNLGRLNSTIEFQTSFGANDPTLSCRISIVIGTLSPQIVCIDRDVTEVRLYPGGGQPQNINITIEPDYS